MCRPCFADCLFGHYRSLITDGKVTFTCVDPGCQRAIKDAEVMRVIGEDATLVEKYERFKRNHAIALNPNGLWCSSPGCDTPIVGFCSCFHVLIIDPCSLDMPKARSSRKKFVYLVS